MRQRRNYGGGKLLRVCDCVFDEIQNYKFFCLGKQELPGILVGGRFPGVSSLIISSTIVDLTRFLQTSSDL